MIKATYVGGAAIQGVPARDLTADEWEQFKESIKAHEAASGITMYRVKRLKTNPKPKPEETGDKDNG